MRQQEKRNGHHLWLRSGLRSWEELVVTVNKLVTVPALVLYNGGQCGILYKRLDCVDRRGLQDAEIKLKASILLRLKLLWFGTANEVENT